MITLGDQYRLNLNGFGDLTNVLKKAPQPQFEALIGLKSNPITTSVISTDYISFSLYYYCIELNPCINHDEPFVLIRNQTKTGMISINKEIMRFGFDLNSFGLIEQDSKGCERVLSQLS